MLPLLAILLCAIVQFGIAFSHYLALADAVRVGARTAAVSRTAFDPAAVSRQAVIDAAHDLGGDGLAVTVSSSWEAGSQVTVTASYPYALNVFGVVLKSGHLTSSTIERVE